MKVTYTATEYMCVPLVLLALLLVGFLLFNILVTRKIATYRRKRLNPFVALTVAVACALLVLGWLFPFFEHAGVLLIPKEYTLVTTAGRIESVTPYNTGRLHWKNGKFWGGSEVSVNGASYYVINDGLLQEDVYIAFDYAYSEHNVILCWWEVTPQQAEQLRAQQPAVLPESSQDAESTVDSPEMSALSAWLLRIGFIGFVGGVILHQFFGEKFALYLFRRGTSVNGEIRPDWKGAMLFNFPLLAFMVMIVIGLITGDDSNAMLFVFLFAICMFAALIIPEATMHVKVEGQSLRIYRLGKERTYCMDDVYSVYWDNCKGITGKMMVLVMCDRKTYWFNMDTFLGVQSVFDLIHAHLSSQDNG